MTAYVEQLCRSEKRVNLVEGSLQIGRLLLSNDQAHRRGLTSFLDLASRVVLLGIFHVFPNYISFQFSYCRLQVNRRPEMGSFLSDSTIQLQSRLQVSRRLLHLNRRPFYPLNWSHV